MIQSSEYILRRKNLASKTGKGVILIPANNEAPMNYPANFFPYRQDSNFLYFCGIDLPGLNLWVDADSGESILFGDDPEIEDIVWTGPVTPLSELAANAGISKVVSNRELESLILSAKNGGRKIHFTPPYRADKQIWISNLLGIPVNEAKSSASSELIHAIVELRSIKSEREIQEIDTACSLTADMHLAAMHTARPGMKESEVFAAVLNPVNRAEGLPSFPPIISINGQVLHIHTRSNLMTEGRLLLVDCGAEVKSHYAGDMTRTFPVGKTFSSRQKDVYEIALAAQVTASGLIKSGITYKEIHLTASKVIAEGLKSLGLLKGDSNEAVAAGAHALFFPHGLGHMMGLDVHDMEDLGENHVGYAGELERSTQFGLAYLRLARKLQPGFVLTNEPGIYFIPELFSIWKKENKHSEFLNYNAIEKYLDFGGIRIEEDFLVTENGSRLLGKPLAKTVKDIETEREKAFT